MEVEMVKALNDNEVRNLQYQIGMANMIAEKLKGKHFDIVSFHSKHHIDSRVLENCTLGRGNLVIDGMMVKIPINPKRFITFDIRENPIVTIESDRQIKIVRNLNSIDTVTKIILINKKD